jgi:hypothetical protein
MKKPLYFAIRVCSLYKPIVAVTSETKGYYGRDKWHGRYVNDNTPTHGVTSDLRDNFETQIEAELCQNLIGVVTAKYDKERKILNQQITQLYAEERTAIETCIDKNLKANFL